MTITNREASSPAHGTSLFLVENGMKGFIKGRKLHKMGLKAQVSLNINHIQVKTEFTQFLMINYFLINCIYSIMPYI